MAANIQNALPKGSSLKSGNHEYVVVKVLGAGGFGITYLVKGKRGNIPVDMAVKEHFMASVCERDATGTQVVYSKPVAQQVEGALKDFISEAQRLNSLDIKSPNIIAIDEVFRANNTAYYVMEYVDGPSLGKIVRENKGKPFSEQEALTIIRPILEAVQNLHNAHITHLDIKPDNILLDYDEITEKQRPVLIDFGLSKHYDEKGAPTSTINLTGCSEGYAPMEQYAGIQSFTPQADVYALAATLYFLLTGQNPPMAANVKSEELRAALSGKCSPEVADAIIRAMHYQLAGRTQSVNEFIRQLFPDAPTPTIPTALVEPVTSTTTSQSSSTRIETPTPNPSEPTPPSSPVISNADLPREEKIRNRITWIIPAVLILLVVALVVIFTIINSPSQEDERKTDSTEQVVEDSVAISESGENLKPAPVSIKEYSESETADMITATEVDIRATGDRDLTDYLNRAKAGDSFGEYMIGQAYSWGRNGLQKDDEKFLFWALKAVNNEEPFVSAAFPLGQYYEKIDKDMAIYWYKKSMDIHWAKHHSINETDDKKLRELGVEYDPSKPN